MNCSINRSLSMFSFQKFMHGAKSNPFLPNLSKMLWLSALLCFLGGISSPLMAQDGKTHVQWLGQSAFRITSPAGKVIVTDPWLKGNPLTPEKFKQLEALGHVDVLLVTHGHWDHFGDAPELARINDIPMYAPGDLNQSATLLNILPAKQLPRMNKCGTVSPVAGIKVTAVHAEHSSVLVWKDPQSGKEMPYPGGEPLGFIIELENGFKIYDMGDTGLFGDMKLIADLYKPDLVLMPIGGNFTLGPKEAAWAIKEWLRPKWMIPMHYGANPLAKGTPDELIKELGSTSTQVLVPKPGDELVF